MEWRGYLDFGQSRLKFVYNQFQVRVFPCLEVGMAEMVWNMFVSSWYGM